MRHISQSGDLCVELITAWLVITHQGEGKSTSTRRPGRDAEFDRPMTKEQKAEYIREKAAEMRRQVGGWKKALKYATNK